MNLANKRFSMLFRQLLNGKGTLQSPANLMAPAASLSSNSYCRKLKNKPLFRNKLSPTHLFQRRFQHGDKDRTISFVDNLAIRHVTAGLFKTFANIIKFNYIQIFYDRGLQLKEFVAGAKAGVCFVSSSLAEGDYETVQGAVTDDTLSAAKESVEELHEDKRCLLKINPEDIFYFNILDIGIIEDGTKRFAEITTIAMAKEKSQRQMPSSLKGFEQTSPENLHIFQIMQFIAAQDSVLLITSRFIREFTKGVTDSWTVNKIHHTFVIPKRG